MTTQDQTNQLQADQNVANSYELKLLQQQLNQLRERSEEKIEILENELAALKKDRDSAMRWGLLTLGAALLGMAGWIFRLITKNIS